MIPVYVFLGFLEAGKTAFVQETLEDPEVNTGEKTLLVVCEEGVEEYEPERFAGGNVTQLLVEDPDDLTPEFLRAQASKVYADRVLVEYNGMWPVQALFDNLPVNWEVFQVMTVADATTFPQYLANMRQQTVDKLQTPDVVIFNRCDKNTDKTLLHRSVRMVNRRAQILFEYKDGSIEPDDTKDPPPYDMTAPVVTIGDEDFGRLTKMMQSVKPEGLGMGLSIVRGIADSHGAELEFKKGEKGGLIVLLTLEAGKVVAEEFARDPEEPHAEQNDIKESK